MTTPETTPTQYRGRVAQGKDWREVVAWVGDLPPMSQVAQRAMQIIENPAANSKELSTLLSSDAALAARVLKIANSALFARQREISTLGQAITVIGFKALKGVIIGATLRQMKSSYEDIQNLIWENSLATAACAMDVTARLKKIYVEEIFLLGLLHSLGQVVFLTDKKTPRLFVDAVEVIKEKGCDWQTAETEIFGFAHPLIGALVAKKWNFSEETCQVILHCKDPLSPNDLQSEMEIKAAIIQFSDLIAHKAGIGNPEGFPDQTERLKELATMLNLDDDSPVEELIDELVEKTAAKFEEDRHLYKG